MKVSLVIPAHNEKDNLGALIEDVMECRSLWRFDLEIIIVDDNSDDGTGELCDSLASKFECIKVVHRKGELGFGRALRAGFEVASGHIVVPLMGDRSDDPHDIVKLLKKIEEGYDLAFGSRFAGGSAEDYPFFKLVLNRGFNWLTRLLFGLHVNDITNAFKAYRREVLNDVQLQSEGFEITAEIPVKAFVKGYKIAEVPVRWYGRRRGISKLKFSRMGPKYMKMILKLFISSKIKRKRG